jgi:hypothetical protein
VAPKVGLDTVVKRKNSQPLPGIEPSNPDRPVRRLVAISIELSWLLVKKKKGDIYMDLKKMDVRMGVR